MTFAVFFKQVMEKLNGGCSIATCPVPVIDTYANTFTKVTKAVTGQAGQNLPAGSG